MEIALKGKLSDAMTLIGTVVAEQKKLYDLETGINS